MSAAAAAARPRVVVRRGRASARLERRPLAVAAVLAVLAVAAVGLSVALGDLLLSPTAVLRSLAGTADAPTTFVVVDLRLPRAVTGLLAGAALGLAGALFQRVTRNPLASPDVVGVAGGASLAGVAVIVLGSTSSSAAVPLAALGGALAAGAALYALAWRGGVHGSRLVLVGIGVAALAQAGVGWVLTEGRVFEVAAAYVWLVGSLNGRGWEHVVPLTIALAVVVPGVLALGPRLAALELGDETARALGVPVEPSRLLLLAGAVVLTGVAVSAAGPIGFVAFVAPHLAARLGRPSGAQALLPLAALCGAVLVLVADLVGRLAFGATEVPVGLVTSILAAPYFLLLLHRTRHEVLA